MTKRKAIVAAMTRLRQEARDREVWDERGKLKYEGYPLPGSIMSEMDAIWDHARIAGLREAATMAGDRHVSLGDWVGQATGAERVIREHANLLAKKARGK